MKKNLLFLAIGIIISVGAMAQNRDVKNDQKKLSNTIVDKKEDKHEAGKDLAHLRINSAMKKREEVRRHKRTIRRESNHLEAHGVKHPMRKAKHMAKAEKEMKKANE